MATSTMAQSRTPPLSLSPAYSAEKSPAMEASDQALQDALMSAVNNSSNAQFLSFLNMSSKVSSNSIAPVATASSSTSTSTSTIQIPGLKLSGNSGIRKSGPVSRAKKVVPVAAPSDQDNVDVDADNDITIKRQRNSLAARKYRQKKIDRISELESEVGQLQEERDALRIKLARQEAETAALREMLMVQNQDRDSDNDSGSKRRRKK